MGFAPTLQAVSAAPCPAPTPCHSTPTCRCETHKVETIRANVIGCLNLADVCLQNGIHMTYYGTGAAGSQGGRAAVAGRRQACWGVPCCLNCLPAASIACAYLFC